MRRVGFTGSRNGITAEQRGQIEAILDKYVTDDIEAHHGMCVGADSEFSQLVVEKYPTKDREIVGHPPLDKSYLADVEVDSLEEPEDYLDRNNNIVDAVQMVIAAPDGPEKHHSGTWSTIRYAKKQGKFLHIVHPDGRVVKIY